MGRNVSPLFASSPTHRFDPSKEENDKDENRHSHEAKGDADFRNAQANLDKGKNEQDAPTPMMNQLERMVGLVVLPHAVNDDTDNNLSNEPDKDDQANGAMGSLGCRSGRGPEMSTARQGHVGDNDSKSNQCEQSNY